MTKTFYIRQEVRQEISTVVDFVQNMRLSIELLEEVIEKAIHASRLIHSEHTLVFQIHCRMHLQALQEARAIALKNRKATATMNVLNAFLKSVKLYLESEFPTKY